MDAHATIPRTRTRAAALAAIAAVGASAVAAPAAMAAPRPATAPAGVVCAVPPAYGPGGGLGPQYGIGEAAPKKGNPAGVRLSRNQLLINQRISQAAILRLKAVENWLSAGIVGTDICGGALAQEDLGGMTLRLDPPSGTRTAPTPRPLVIPKATPGNPDKVQLSRTQLLINQRISQEAVRRANALAARMETGLTGGDVKNGTITQNNLRPGMRVLAASTTIAAPAPSTTVLAPKKPGDPSKVTLSSGQLLINQRISQASVRRVNGLMAHIRTGLNGSDFRANTITAVDLAPGTVRP